jgi:hypothetical protein
MPGARRPFAVVAATLLAALAVLPGCGGGGEEGGGQSLTKADLVAQGDQICEQARQEFADSEPPAPSTPEQAAALQQALIQTSEREVSRLRALEVQAGAEPALDRYLKAREQGIVVLRRGLRAAREEDLAAYGAAQRQMAAAQVNRLKLAQAVGFHRCSRPSAPASGE